MRRASGDWLFVALVLAIGAPACEKTDGNTDGGTGKEVSTPPPGDTGPAPTGVIELKKAGESAVADFSKGQEFLIVPYSVSDIAASGIAFTIKLGAGGGADGGIGEQSFPLRLPRRASLRQTNPALWARWQQRLAVEAWTRSQAERAAARIALMPRDLDHKLAACQKSADCAATEVCAAGACAATFKIKTAEIDSATPTIDVEVKKKGSIAALLFDKKDSYVDADATAILEKFEKVIHPRNVALFGDPELKAGAGVRSSDRNKDGLVWLVLSKVVQKRKNAVGFFNAKDFTDEAGSNQADILYVDSAAKPADVYTILAHEHQHLLGFGSKVWRPQQNGGQGALEALWLDEGQAHFAEDACGFGGEAVVLLSQEVFPNFPDTSLFEGSKSKDTNAMRGMAFTFVRYLFEQKGGVSYSASTITDKGGAAFLKQLHTSTQLGTAAVSEAAAPHFKDFKEAFDYWIAAVSLDGRGVTSYPKYVYQELVDDPVGGAKIGVKIRGSRKDHTGATVELKGPLEEEITKDATGTIPNATARFYLLKGKTGKVSVTVSSQESDFRFAVVKVK
jgi:hypothetical protein